MATGWPMKTTYADGDVYSASDVNDITGTINLLGSSVAYTAAKNKIINGDFRINQRSFTSTTSDQTYGFDRWVTAFSDGTSTYSAQTFTLGAAPVAGYEGTNFARIASTGQTLTTALTSLAQRVESVKTLAGQTATISFWAKAAAGTPNVVVWINQSFGSGGSPSAAVNTGTTKQAITTSWARYSFTVAIPSISGKTLGTANDDRLNVLITTSAGTGRSAYTDSLGIQTATIDIWGVQVEQGSTMTAFQTASGTLGGELALCQRYYFRHTAAAPTVRLGIYAISGTTTQANGYIQFPVPMRVAPTSMDTNTLKYSNYAGVGFNITSLAYNEASEVIAQIYGTISVTTLATPGSITSQAVGSYLGFSAEL
jgi:hypothetical protein